MSIREFDTVVIGSGPAGEGAAMKLAKSDQRVAIVEAYPRVGGGCTHWGTIPSKALRHAIQLLADYRSNPLFQKTVGQLDIGYPELLAAAGSVIDQQVGTRYRYYQRNRVDLVHGRARFTDPHSIEARTPQGTVETLRARNIVIATGSRPYHPDDVDFDHTRILDSDTLLGLERTPRSVTIYGAGVIGCEYASIFGNLDIKTNLVNTRDRLLSFLDDEITDALGYHLRNQGIVIRHQEVYGEVEPLSDGVVLHCQSGKKFKTDYLLWANGRTGNTNGMGLEEIGIAVNHRGQIEVDGDYRTVVPHIFAAGDVIGLPGLASASYDQGRYVAAQIVGEGDGWDLVKDFPTGIYTMPEISSVGPTERDLTSRNVPYEVGRALFRSIARAQITGHTVGMLKLLFHRETLEILAIHCFGEEAAEIIHIGQAIMRQPPPRNSVRYFTETTFNYPTMAEAYREAALNGLNRIF